MDEDALTGGRAARGAGFTVVEDLVVCKAFIAASEDPIKGTSQKGHTFVATMHNSYVVFIQEQEARDRADYARASSVLRAEQPLPQVYSRRNGLSIYKRFKLNISPRVMKFIAIEKVTKMESGWDDEMFYDTCKSSYSKRHPKWGNFDDLRRCKEYLEGKPKFSDFRKLIDLGEKNRPPVGNKKAKQAESDKKLIAQLLAGTSSGNAPRAPAATSKESSISTTSKSQHQKPPNPQAALFSTIGNAISTLGSALTERWERDDNDKFVASLPTPDRKEWQQEQYKLRLVEMRMKRRRLEESICDTTTTTPVPEKQVVVLPPEEIIVTEDAEEQLSSSTGCGEDEEEDASN
jgi:hypothetical protein